MQFEPFLVLPTKSMMRLLGKTLANRGTVGFGCTSHGADRKFIYVKRYKKNLLVFFPPGEGMKLNHWVIEE